MASSSSSPVYLLMLFVCLLFPFEAAASAYSNVDGNTLQQFDFTDGLPERAAYITIEGDATVVNNSVQIPSSHQYESDLMNKAGRVTFSEPIQIWTATPGKSIDFETGFSFTIEKVDSSSWSGLGDGFAFFMAPVSSRLPLASWGGYLGLVSRDVAFNSSSTQPFVAVEFDTFPNSWDPRTAHIGINVNSIASQANVAWNSSEVLNGSYAVARIRYNSSSTELSVRVVHPATGSTYTFGYLIDLRTVLPEKVRIGFSASTSRLIEINTMYDWYFVSTYNV